MDGLVTFETEGWPEVVGGEVDGCSASHVESASLASALSEVLDGCGGESVTPEFVGNCDLEKVDVVVFVGGEVQVTGWLGVVDDEEYFLAIDLVGECGWMEVSEFVAVVVL